MPLMRIPGAAARSLLVKELAAFGHSFCRRVSSETTSSTAARSSVELPFHSPRPFMKVWIATYEQRNGSLFLGVFKTPRAATWHLNVKEHVNPQSWLRPSNDVLEQDNYVITQRQVGEKE